MSLRSFHVRMLSTKDQHLAPKLTEIAFKAKRHWGYPEEWIQAWTQDLAITAEQIRRQTFWAAFPEDDEADPVGFTVLDVSDEPGILGLEHMWVDPDFHGHGLGRTLFEALMEQVRGQDAHTLEVYSDPGAEGFYRRLGFEPHRVSETLLLGQPRRLPVLRLSLEDL